MKATFQLPDELYREVKAATARDGRTVREVTISLFERWLRERNQPDKPASAVDWRNFKAPLAHLVPAAVTDHSMTTIRENIARHWNEPL